MKNSSRREFITTGSKGLGAVIALSQLPLPFLINTVAESNTMPIGFQTFPIRDILAKDFPGTLKMMAGHGYQLVEMCSPQGYETNGFGPLMNIKPPEMKSIISDAGLNCPSCHFTFPETQNSHSE